MKNIFISMTTCMFLLLGLYSCQQVEDLSPSISRSGINSITASFADDASTENAFSSEINYETGVITIVFPYNYPRTSDNVLTMDKLTHMRIQANLDDNVTVSPTLLYLDLTKENFITVTDQSKNQKQYKIVAEIRKSAECQITDFQIPSLGLTGVIDQNSKTISLISIESIGSVLANATISHGAVINPNPSTQSLNYDNAVSLKVTAQDGTTSATYTVKKAVPVKTSFGMRSGSAKILWVKKLGADLGISTLNLTTGLAVTKDYVVVNTRGINSVYLDRKTGQIVGSVNLSDKVGSLVNFYNTCDDENNILLCNLAPNAGSFKIWRIRGVNGTPEAYIDWNGGLAVGRKISVRGSLDGNALITAPILAAGNKFALWQVKSGVLQSQTPTIITISGLSANWSNNCDIIYTNGSNPASDYFAAYYASPYQLTWVNGTTNTTKSFGPTINSNWISNATDYTVFNTCPYVTQNSINSFTWGSDDTVYLYDVSTSLGTAIWSATIGKYGGKDNGGQNANGTGDVALKVSDNGYYMYMYFMFTNGCVVCVQFDCIAQ